jgi:mono/diheme cytochrome c family protein
MMPVMWNRAMTAAACAVLVCACGPPDAADFAVPAQDAELVAAGEAIYQATCSSCHGSDLRGTGQGPSHLSAVYRPSHHSDAAFLLAVKVGAAEHHWRFGAMDPIPGLTDEDIAAVTAFVRDRQRNEGFEPYPP